MPNMYSSYENLDSLATDPITRFLFAANHNRRRIESASHTSISSVYADTTGVVGAAHSHEVALARLSMRLIAQRKATHAWARRCGWTALGLCVAVLALTAAIVYIAMLQEPLLVVSGAAISDFNTTTLAVTVWLTLQNPNLRPVTATGTSLECTVAAPAPDYSAVYYYRLGRGASVPMDWTVGGGDTDTATATATFPLLAMPRRLDLVGSPASALCDPTRGRFLAVSVSGAVQVRLPWGRAVVPVAHTAQLYAPGYVPSALACVGT